MILLIIIKLKYFDLILILKIMNLYNLKYNLIKFLKKR